MPTASNKLKIVAIIPAFNEQRTIKQVIVKVAQYVDQIVVVDDGSTDNTFSLAKHPKVVRLRHLLNLGQGAALQTGFEYVLTLPLAIIVTFDADNQFYASQIPRLVNPIQDDTADIVFGSRFLGKTVDISWTRWLILKLAITFTNFFSNVKLTDTHNGFRTFNHQALNSIHLTHNDMTHASEIIEQVASTNLRYQEIPVTVRYFSNPTRPRQRNSAAFKIAINLLLKKFV